MRKFREFKCADCQHLQERLVEDDVKEMECPECKGVSHRKLSAPTTYGNSAHKGLRSVGGFN